MRISPSGYALKVTMRGWSLERCATVWVPNIASQGLIWGFAALSS
jgi:hypothetical protein